MSPPDRTAIVASATSATPSTAYPHRGVSHLGRAVDRETTTEVTIATSAALSAIQHAGGELEWATGAIDTWLVLRWREGVRRKDGPTFYATSGRTRFIDSEGIPNPRRRARDEELYHSTIVPTCRVPRDVRDRIVADLRDYVHGLVEAQDASTYTATMAPPLMMVSELRSLADLPSLPRHPAIGAKGECPPAFLQMLADLALPDDTGQAEQAFGTRRMVVADVSDGDCLASWRCRRVDGSATMVRLDVDGSWSTTPADDAPAPRQKVNADSLDLAVARAVSAITEALVPARIAVSPSALAGDGHPTHAGIRQALDRALAEVTALRGAYEREVARRG